MALFKSACAKLHLIGTRNALIATESIADEKGVSLDNFAELLVQENLATGSEIMLPPVPRLCATNTGIGFISIIRAEGARGCSLISNCRLTVNLD
jgi:hypothetical protein